MRVFSFIVFFFLSSLSSIFVHAQNTEEKKKVVIEPVLSFRSFWMNTTYPNHDFRNDYALGLTSILGGKLTVLKKWQLQSGYRVFANALSSDFWLPDPVTGQANRYESGLFNLLDPKDRFFGRLELLSLGYSQSRFGVKVGKMGIQSDWVNAQDGRLSPTVVEGVQVWYAPNDIWKVHAWGITRMNVRGSKDWLMVGETLGLFPQGRRISGNPATYFRNTSSSWLGIWELEGKMDEGKTIRFSQTYAANLFSTYWATFEKTSKKLQGTWTIGIQGGLQHGLGEGGNLLPELQYKNPRDLNFAISSKINLKKGPWEAQLSATQVGGKGRWLSPREWGKDAWYTFIPRERNEGFETVTAMVGFASYRMVDFPLNLYTYGGIHILPSVQNSEANKYNFPSYRQHNLGLNYTPKKIKNLDFHLILMIKEPLSSKKLIPIQQYNKVDLWHFNALINWKLVQD